MSLLFFLIWTFQLVRSLYHYYNLQKNDRTKSENYNLKSLFAIHVMMKIANLMYLGYEMNPWDT